MALVRAATNTAKLADALRSQWSERTKLRADANDQAWDLILRAQVDEVFLVLAHLGEATLPLGVFNKDYYLQTLGEVKASLASCGNDMLVTAWEELDAELQYCCCAGLTFCAHFSPMPVYRGFGACVLSDWDWGCPDVAHLEEKARKKAIRTVYGVKQKTDAQPGAAVFQDFDQAIQILQVKPMAFFVKRPPLSGFTEQPRFGIRPKKEVKADLDLLEDWFHQIVRRGHPSPAGRQISTWGFPYATWTSEASFSILRSEKDYETLLLNQMDPGRLLHAFVCRRAAVLDEHSMYLLLPRSAAESLICWLEGLEGYNHQIVRWSDLETEAFEKKISKSLRKKIGNHPIPVKYAIRHPGAGLRPLLHATESPPAVLEHPNTVSPPHYSQSNAPRSAELPSTALPERAATTPVAELAAPETSELPADAAERPAQPARDAAKERSAGGLKSIFDLRRKSSSGIVQAAVASSTEVAASTTRHPTILRPGALKHRSSSSFWTDDIPTKASESETRTEKPFVAELPAELPVDTSASPAIVRKPVPTVSVQAPTPDEAAVEPLALDRESSTTTMPTQVVPPAASTKSNYLELLNKVARGEISPQALGEMLQNGSIGQSTTTTPSDKPTAPAAVMPAMPDAAETQTATVPASGPSTTP